MREECKKKKKKNHSLDSSHDPLHLLLESPASHRSLYPLNSCSAIHSESSLSSPCGLAYNGSPTLAPCTASCDTRDTCNVSLSDAGSISSHRQIHDYNTCDFQLFIHALITILINLKIHQPINILIKKATEKDRKVRFKKWPQIRFEEAGHFLNLPAPWFGWFLFLSSHD